MCSLVEAWVNFFVQHDCFDVFPSIGFFFCVLALLEEVEEHGVGSLG